MLSIGCTVTHAPWSLTNLLLRELQCWVGGQLLADGGVESSAQVLAAGRAGTMGGKDLQRRRDMSIFAWHTEPHVCGGARVLCVHLHIQRQRHHFVLQ